MPTIDLLWLGDQWSDAFLTRHIFWSENSSNWTMKTFSVFRDVLECLLVMRLITFMIFDYFALDSKWTVELKLPFICHGFFRQSYLKEQCNDPFIKKRTKTSKIQLVLLDVGMHTMFAAWIYMVSCFLKNIQVQFCPSTCVTSCLVHAWPTGPELPWLLFTSLPGWINMEGIYYLHSGSVELNNNLGAGIGHKCSPSLGNASLCSFGNVWIKSTLAHRKNVPLAKLQNTNIPFHTNYNYRSR